MEITKASASDIPDLCQLLYVLFSQEVEFSPDQDAQAKGLYQIIENPEIGHILVAKEKNGDTVGMVSVLFTVSTALGGRVAVFEDMVVMPGARGDGIGSQLLEGAIQSARLSCCKRVTLLTDRENTAAQRFYEKHGFSESTMIPLRLLLV
jgi:GNAT superfamily N-acetyltransferase